MSKICWKISRKSLLRKEYRQRSCKRNSCEPNSLALKKFAKVIVQMADHQS